MLKLLIVDDEWVIREGLEKTIPWKEWGIAVTTTAKNGNEALQILEQHKLDILLTDIRMPGINGLDLIASCKDRYPALKIVILTGHNEFEYAQKALRLGADDILLKPTNVDELKRTMLHVAQVLREEQIEDLHHLSYLAKSVIEDPTQDKIQKLKSHDRLNPNFCIIIIKNENHVVESIPSENCVLLEQTAHKHIYLFHHVENESDFERLINEQIINIKQKETNIFISLLTEDLADLLKIYKQSSVATFTFYKNETLTIYKYRDEKYTLGIEDAIRYINSHFNSSISQVDMANQLYMSNSYFSKLFKQHTGMNFVDYITLKRINAAKQMLRATNLKTYEIAKEVGYEESRYFSQLFKKKTSYTPMEYRERHS
ncbi:response regulator transcription factor [Oceanobacillus manasiensis]|uniref:response regulator transcription factor n=1 Tax=Oceanobacillus manasiensis TaxID=586413 RepID=UPI0005AAC982|nr:response regulator [Oceanobacillus manasiensis]